MFTPQASISQNLALLTDSYKISHWRQYPPGTSTVYSYFESRGGQFPQTMFFGLQYILDRYLARPFTWDDLAEAKEITAKHFGSDGFFNPGWTRLLYKHDGRLPVRIRAVPEGTVVPTHNVLMTIENTDPEFFWLTNYLETILSQVWYPTTVATLSSETRSLILRYLQRTGDPSLIDFKLHDFGFRGASSLETAAIGGGAHLVNFKGTDTVPALMFLRDYYGAEEMPGFSVPASEHSTITSWGKEAEVDAYRNMIEQYGDSPFYSVVSDSYDLYSAARNIWGGTLQQEVLGAPGTLVIRPDSGAPAVVVPNLLRILSERFGATRNEKGYLVLNPKVRVIQGDGMDYNLIEQTLASMEMLGFSADNVTFGMGGGLLQKVNRDTQKFAFKCSSAVVDGVERDVYKDPATDHGKVSKRGRLSLIHENGSFKTLRERPDDALVTVFEDGEIVKRYTLDEVRGAANVAAVVGA